MPPSQSEETPNQTTEMASPSQSEGTTKQTTEMAPPSQSEGTISGTTEMEPKKRPLMPADLYRAVIEGNMDVLEQRLGLAVEKPNHVKVQIEGSDPARQQSAIQDHSFESELQSATRFGNTILHVLVADKRHNELALKVFQKDMSLLTAQNKELETPLHSAAKFGNVEVIQSLLDCAPVLIKNVVRKTNDNGDTALHIATKNGQKEVVRLLMQIDSEMTYEFNKEGLSPFHLAIADDLHYAIFNDLIGEKLINDENEIFRTMLDVDPTMAYTQFSDGTFPIHVAARMGKGRIISEFIRNNPKCALLLDSCGRNLFHVAAEENNVEVTWTTKRALRELDIENREDGEYCKELINAKDCQGNTPLHTAAVSGTTMRDVAFLWHDPDVDRERPNNRGHTPFKFSALHQLKESNLRERFKIRRYIRQHGLNLSKQWYDLLKEPTPQEVAERTQVIGLGSVLITTIAFAAAFTFPGGYNGDNGTPILGRRYMFRAFMVANALAFVQSFASIFLLIKNYFWSGYNWSNDNLDPEELIESAALLFLSSATSMVKAFGIGSYVMLAPVNLPIAIIILTVSMLFGSSTVIALLGPLPRHLSKWLSGEKHNIRDDYYCANVIRAILNDMSVVLAMWAIRHGWPYLLIFGVAFLK